MVAVPCTHGTVSRQHRVLFKGQDRINNPFSESHMQGWVAVPERNRDGTESFQRRFAITSLFAHQVP
jgi:hypothetical protein